MLTNDASGTREIKRSIAMEKAAFRKKTVLTIKWDLNLRKKVERAAV
jgi:hypothetical protein